MKTTHSWNKSVRLLRWLAGALLLTAFTVSCKANVSTPIAVSGVTLDKATVTLVEQETVTLKATVKPANATNKAVTWSSNKPDVAAVDKDGKVTAHKAGEAVITVKSEDGGKTASCTVKVTAKPPTTYKVTFSVDGTGGTLKAKAEGIAETETSPITIEQGKTVTFTAKPADGYEVEKWTVNGTTVANNVSTTYSHKVTTAVMVKVSFKALPPPAVAVTGVTLDKPTVSLVAGTSTTLTATVLPANATNKTVTWSSDKPAIASVDKNGTVTAHKAGEAVITVKSEDGAKTASCTVTVSLTEYVITYHLDGGSNHADNPAKYTVETETITLKDASKANYTFAGWYEKADFTGEKVTQIVKGSSGNKELWAKFLENYTITYNLNGGSNHADNPANYTVETETITLRDAAKANYTFAGWYASADFSGEKVTEITKGSSGNKELWAKFLENYAITYHLDGGSNHADNPAKYTVETETITLKPAEKADHIFFGWYASADFSGEKVTEIRKESSGNKELYAKFIEMKMIDIAAVTDGTVGHSSEFDNKVHTVSLTAYRIGESEVTQELWQAVMGNNPSRFKGAGNPPDGSEVQERRPVERVNWYECIAFCNELTKKVAELGESQCVYSVEGHIYGTADAVAKKVPEMDMSKKGFRLPTEAEWEWAAKGGTEYKWAGTNERSELGTYAWYSAISNSKTHEVKQMQPNRYGLYDMSGNVREWCWDWYGTLPNPLPEDYSGAASGFGRVLRGGSWYDSADYDYASRAYRSDSGPVDRDYGLGLRVVSRP